MREERAAVAVSRQIDDEDIADVEEECKFAQRDVVDAEVMQDEFERGIGMEDEMKTMKTHLYHQRCANVKKQ